MTAAPVASRPSLVGAVEPGRPGRRAAAGPGGAAGARAGPRLARAQPARPDRARAARHPRRASASRPRRPASWSASSLEGGFVDDASYAHALRRRPPAARRLGLRPHRAPAARSSASRPSTSPPRSREQDRRSDELEAAIALLRRRVPDPPATPRERDRALGILVRKGYDLELALRRRAAPRRRGRPTRLAERDRARVIARTASRYYDPPQRQTGPAGPLKLQQNSHFQRDSSSFSRVGDPHHRSRARRPGQTHNADHLAAS